MRLIDLERLRKFPIRIDHYDEENGNIHFVYGVESVLEYAESLPQVDAIPIDWIKQYIFNHPDSTLQMVELVDEWRRQNAHETD